MPTGAFELWDISSPSEQAPYSLFSPSYQKQCDAPEDEADCVVPESIRTSPHGRSLEIPRAKGGLKSQTFRRKV